MLRAPPGLRRVRGILFAFGGPLLAASVGAMALGCSDDEALDRLATRPWILPSFVMELETFAGGTPYPTIVLTYVSRDEWLWEVFDTAGSLSRSHRLESGRLTITAAPYGVIHSAADPGANYSPPASDWFISPSTARGRGARQLDGLPAFERDVVITCGPDDQRCAPGETLRMTQRIDYDAATGIPIAYTEAHNGVIVHTVRATRLAVEQSGRSTVDPSSTTGYRTAGQVIVSDAERAAPAPA